MSEQVFAICCLGYPDTRLLLDWYSSYLVVIGLFSEHSINTELVSEYLVVTGLISKYLFRICARVSIRWSWMFGYFVNIGLICKLIVGLVFEYIRSLPIQCVSIWLLLAQYPSIQLLPT